MALGKSKLKLEAMQPAIVPFKGGGELAAQLLSGWIDVDVLNPSEASAQIDAGDISPMVVLDAGRMAPIPDAKTAKEMGVPAEFATVRGFVTHSGMSDANAAYIENSLLKAMDHRIYQAYRGASGLDKNPCLGREPGAHR